MTTLNLGRVRPDLKGLHDPSVVYSRLDLVTSAVGSIYTPIVEQTTIGAELTDATQWALIMPRAFGWTHVTYDEATGKFTFHSNDGLGFVSPDMRAGGAHLRSHQTAADTANPTLDLASHRFFTIPELGADTTLSYANIPPVGEGARVSLVASQPWILNNGYSLTHRSEKVWEIASFLTEFGLSFNPKRMRWILGGTKCILSTDGSTSGWLAELDCAVPYDLRTASFVAELRISYFFGPTPNANDGAYYFLTDPVFSADGMRCIMGNTANSTSYPCREFTLSEAGSILSMVEVRDFILPMAGNAAGGAMGGLWLDEAGTTLYAVNNSTSPQVSEFSLGADTDATTVTHVATSNTVHTSARSADCIEFAPDGSHFLLAGDDSSYGRYVIQVDLPVVGDITSFAAGIGGSNSDRHDFYADAGNSNNIYCVRYAFGGRYAYVSENQGAMLYELGDLTTYSLDLGADVKRPIGAGKSPRAGTSSHYQIEAQGGVLRLVGETHELPV